MSSQAQQLQKTMAFFREASSARRTARGSNVVAARGPRRGKEAIRTSGSALFKDEPDEAEFTRFK